MGDGGTVTFPVLWVTSLVSHSVSRLVPGTATLLELRVAPVVPHPGPWGWVGSVTFSRLLVALLVSGGVVGTVTFSGLWVASIVPVLGSVIISFDTVTFSGLLVVCSCSHSSSSKMSPSLLILKYVLSMLTKNIVFFLLFAPN